MQKAVVVGGGFTGLVTAYYLSRAGFKVSLFEASERLGGLIGTHYHEWGLVETAANGLINTENLEALFADVKVNMCYSRSESKKRYIFREKLRRWPLGVATTLKVAGQLLKIRAFGGKSLQPNPDESVAQWVSRVFNQEALDYLLAPALQGVYAGNPEELSAELIFSPLFAPQTKQNIHFRGTVAPLRGMGELILALENRLLRQSVDIYMNMPYAMTTAPDVPHFICTGPKAAARLVQSVDSKLAAQLQSIDVLPLVSVTQSYPRASGSKVGFGCLFPQNERFNSLGVLFNGFIFPERTSGHSETWIMGGAKNPEVLDVSDKELIRLIGEDRKRVYGTDDAPLEYEINRWPQAVPHYTTGLAKFLRELQPPQNIFLQGNYLGALGLSKILDNVKQQVDSLEV